MVVNDRKALLKERDKINAEIDILNKNLINALNTIGIEYIDLYAFIDRLNVLMSRKNKIHYLLAIEI